MEMHQIRYFLSVSECLNFTEAAERCQVTQPALTRAIQKLEEELGGLLFRRERKLTHLTDLGLLVRPQLEAVYEQSERAKSTAKSFVQLKDAPIRLGVMCTIGPVRFVGFLAEFGARHSGIDLSMNEGVPDQLSHLLLGGSLDVAIMTEPRPSNEKLKLRRLFDERMVIAFPPGHRFQEMKAIPVSAINGESYLQRANCEQIDALNEICSNLQVRTETVYRSEREDWIQTMIVAGMGIAFMPESVPMISGLMTRPVIEPEVIRTIYLASVSEQPFSPAVAAFVEEVEGFDWPGLSPLPE